MNEELRPATPPAPMLDSDRLTVVESLYFHPVGRGAVEMDSRWSRQLSTAGDQPYQRYLTARREWQPVDCGWVSNVGMIVVQNEEGTGLDASNRPTSTVDEDPVIEVAYDGAHDGDSIFILPRESLRIRPRNPKNLRIRCPDGSARYRLLVISR